MPGYVPKFEQVEIGNTFDKHATMGMDMTIKKMLMLKDAGMVPEDEEEAAAKLEEAEREKNRGARKQQSLITRARAAEAETRKKDRGGVSSDEESIGSDEERQILNGTHHSMFGNTGPLFGDTFPESALAPTAGAALGRPPNTGSSASELRAMRQQMDQLHSQDPDEHAGAFPDYDFTPVTYLVTVFTGDRLGAATDARVSVELHGENGHSGKQPLLGKAGAPEPFQRGARDRFKIDWPDLGRLREITLSHSNTGMTPGWFVDKVLIQNLKTKKKWTYTVHRWFDRDDGDGAIERKLVPGDE